MPADAKKPAAAEGAKGKDGKPAAAVPVKKPEPKQLTPVEVLHRNISLLDKFVDTRDPSLLSRAMRFTGYVRRHAPLSSMRAIIDSHLTGARKAAVSALFDTVAPLRKEPTVSTSEVDMLATPATAGAAPAPAAAPAALKPTKTSPAAAPEIDAYFTTLALSMLSGAGAWEALFTAAVTAVDHMDGMGRRTLDFFSARAYSYVALASDALHRPADALLHLLSTAHRAACLRHDDYGAATLLNLTLRLHLNSGSLDAASKLLARATFPEAASTSQYVRYLYYSGRIRALQLEYSDAHAALTQAARKAPLSAVGFRARATQLSVLVQLLMGDVPERSTFTSRDTAPALAPYLHITRAVRSGDIAAFNAALATHAAALQRDGTLTLARRLGSNVVTAGLRALAKSYSRISFVDIAAKLQLGSPEDAAFLAAKAIRDGVIDASLSLDAAGITGVMTSSEVVDVYTSGEPQQAFHRRITFCLDVHNEAVKSMRYPPHANREDLETAEKRAAREAEEAELAKELEEGAFDEDD